MPQVEQTQPSTCSRENETFYSEVKKLAVQPILPKAARGYGGGVFVRIRTGRGIEGIGECFSWDGTDQYA